MPRDLSEVGVGTIAGVEVDQGIATVILDVPGAELRLYGNKDMTMTALTALFDVPPPPAPPSNLAGKRVTFCRDGKMLLWLGEA